MRKILDRQQAKALAFQYSHVARHLNARLDGRLATYYLKSCTYSLQRAMEVET